ncbi:MAG TPA: amino acid ABC transporter substrate-binding protein, partial [Ramlibacter sp.]|nr:amino acid ABC transporter substrate-binding protein [Ramlibacter sp.]
MQLVKKALAALVVGASLCTPAFAKEGPTVAAIKKRGSVNCGVFGVIPGFSLPDSRGVMRGIDADACRAIAAAVLGNPEAVKWVILTAQQRLPALQSGEVDVVYANLGWTLSREAQSGVAYASIYYYNGQAFMVKKSLNVKSAKDLNGVSICLTQGSSIEQSVQEYFATNRMTYKPVVFADVSEARKAFLADRCDSTAGDSSSLAGFKAAQGAAGDKYVILPERISNEPLGGAVRKGDGQWFDIVRWTHFALVQAEAMGITSDNIDTFKASKQTDIRRFLGEEGDLGGALGLEKTWAYKVVK